MKDRPLPVALRAYRLATAALEPAAPFLLRRRAARGKEDPARLGERLATAMPPRPEGDLVWVHGASVGEALSLLPIVAALTARGLHVLVTAGTRTAAGLLATRLPPGARHHYLPLDAPRIVRRFLDHWRPHLALFAESEVWPNIVLALAAHGIPLLLVNGRMSERSFAAWNRWPEPASALFGRFALCLAQSDADGHRLGALGAPVAVTGNLKFDAAPSPADPGEVERHGAWLAGRPVWMAASTHGGEDAIVLDAHGALRARFPRLLTILAPRHPERADAVAALAAERGLAVTRRSEGNGMAADVDVHLVDTIGELGLFYRLAPLVVMGGSFVPHGGQNPIEPARLGAAILHGPHVGNFVEPYGALDEADGARCVGDGAALAAVAADLLAAPARLRDMARRAGEAVGRLGGALPRTMAAIGPYLPPARDGAGAAW